MNASDVADMTRVLAVGSIGWVVSGSSLEVGIKVLVAFASLAYMLGKAILVWRAILKGTKHEEKNL